MNVRTKFEVRSFTHSWDNREYSKNLRSPWIRPRSFFSQTFHGILSGWTLWMYLPNLEFWALTVPEIIAIAVLGWRCEPQSWGRGGRRGSGLVPLERALVNSYRHSIVTVSSVSTRFRDITAFVLQHATFTHTTSCLPKMSPCFPRNR